MPPLVRIEHPADGEPSHCSACGRKLRKKIVRGGLGGNAQGHAALGYTDWLGHAKQPMCSRYGLAADTNRAE